MTLQNLSKILDKYDAQQLGSTRTQELEVLSGLPFYHFQDPTDTNTFNHAIGLPQKNGIEFPLFEYEQLLYNELQSHKHLWIKKATGLGITEFMLRYMAWLCFRGITSDNSSMTSKTRSDIELSEHSHFSENDAQKGDYQRSSTTVNDSQIASDLRSEIRLSEHSRGRTGVSTTLNNSSVGQESRSDTELSKHSQFSQNDAQKSNYQDLSGSQMCIVTGPRIELAITLIDRMKGLFQNSREGFDTSRSTILRSQKTSIEHRIAAGQQLFDTKETVIELNGVHIEAYPSHHLDAMRGLKDVAFVYLDEADFFPPGQQQDARDVSERYIAKSNPWIVMVSTPNASDGLFEKIEKEPENTCLYKRLFLDYTYGIDKIYTEQEIALAQQSPSFEREYNLKYLGKVGNVFHTLDIEAAICTQQEGQQMMDWSTSTMLGRSMGIDVAWGDTSKFAIVITQYRNNKVEVFYAESFEKPQMNYIINHIMQLKLKHHCTKIYVDGANPEVIRELKSRIGEYHDYYGRLTEEQIWSLRSSNSWQIIPVNFQKRHREMLQWTYTLMSKRKVKIHLSLQKLIVSLRTAVVSDGWKLDKQQTSHDDVLDSFRLALCNYELPKNI